MKVFRFASLVRRPRVTLAVRFGGEVGWQIGLVERDSPLDLVGVRLGGDGSGGRLGLTRRDTVLLARVKWRVG